MWTLYVTSVITLYFLSRSEMKEHGDLNIFDRPPNVKSVAILCTGAIVFSFGFIGFIVICIMYLP